MAPVPAPKTSGVVEKHKVEGGEMETTLDMKVGTYGRKCRVGL